jgi:hypothetical protein
MPLTLPEGRLGNNLALTSAASFLKSFVSESSTNDGRGCFTSCQEDTMKWIGMLAVAGMCAACGGTKNDQPVGTDGTVDPAAGAPATAAAPSRPTPAPAPPAPTFRDITLPAGTTLLLDLQTAVASDTSSLEDAVRGSLRQAIEVDGREILPVGTELAGVVTDVDRSGRVKGKARVAYRFSSLSHQGERYDIATAAIAHEAEATKKEDATKIAIGAGAGAAIGAILGGGDGAAKGAAIGGGGGTGVVLATRGKEIRLGPGANVTTRLTAPLTIRVRL